MKVKNLLICILVMSFIMCPLTVFAESFEEDLIITDMTDEELEDLMGVQTYASTTETLNIAKWQKVIDTSKNDINGYSVAYYAPVYNGILYNNYMIIKGQTSSASTTNKYRLIYYTDDITWVNKPIKFSDGILIMIESTATDIDTLKEYLYNPNAERTAVSATVRTSTEGTQMYWSDRAQTTYTTNENHHDTYYIWYQNMYNNEPPILTENGACAKHQYNMITSAASCTRPGGITYICRNCNYSYFEETVAKLEHTFEDNVCTVCGTEYSAGTETPDDSGNGNSGNSGNNNTNIDYGDLSFLGKVNTVVQSKLNDNSMYNSLLYIVNTLTSLFTEDYTSAEGFYSLGLTDLTLRKPYVEYSANLGNDIIGDYEITHKMQTSNIDWGLDNVQVMNLDWYFGKVVGYTGDGTPYRTKGVKETADTIIAGFMWLVFGWNVYINLPNLISGEGGQIVSAYGAATRYTKEKKAKAEKVKTETKGDKKS